MEKIALLLCVIFAVITTLMTLIAGAVTLDEKRNATNGWKIFLLIFLIFLGISATLIIAAITLASYI